MCHKEINMSLRDINKNIEDKLNELKKHIRDSDAKTDIYNKEIAKLRKVKIESLYSIICNYLNIGDILLIPYAYVKNLRGGDEIEIIKKNRKSILIKIIDTRLNLVQKDTRVDTIVKIQSHIFARYAIQNDSIRKIIDRNEIINSIING